VSGLPCRKARHFAEVRNMNTVTKSPRKVAAVALEVERRTFPKYGHRYSRQDYTLPQLFAIHALRQFFGTDYRGIVAILEDWPTLREELGLARIPHFTTIQKAERRLFSAEHVRRLLTNSVGIYHGDDPDAEHAHAVEQTAADATGFECHQASRYFVRRRARSPDNAWQTTSYRDFAKLMIAVDCANHLILATHTGKGPRPDVDQLEDLMRGWCANAIPDQFLADAGFASEANHERLREHDIETVIPPELGRPTEKLPSGKWRALVVIDFNEEDYGQLWQSETVMFMLKRHLGETLAARKHHSRRREMALRSITHNIMIAYVLGAFLQGNPAPLFCPHFFLACSCRLR